MEDVSRYPDLFVELLRSGNWTGIDLQKVAGRNLLRVMRRVEKGPLSTFHEGCLQQ
ncbi:hypothetical protein FOCC_FOCC004498 [Frankliniella occidentalis]|nr:hypothetical protein FOCC_FOCC004498 [Frankliniella occidentalis]